VVAGKSDGSKHFVWGDVAKEGAKYRRKLSEKQRKLFEGGFLEKGTLFKGGP